MSQPTRNCRLWTALIIAIIAGILYLTLFNIFSFFDWLPDGDVGFLRQPTAEQLIRLEVQANEQVILFEKAGTYRIFAPRRTLSAQNLVVESTTNGQMFPLTPLPDYLEEYDTELIEGFPLFDIQIDQPGAYTIYTVNSSEDTHALLIAPDYSAQNRVRTILALVIPVVGFLVYWYITGRPVASKATRQEKRNKFEELL